MSLSLAVALCLQTVALFLLRHRLGRGWLRRPVTVLAFVAVICQGLPEVLLVVPSIRVWDIDRLGISQSFIDSATLGVSAALVALVACYLITKPERVSLAHLGNEPRMAAIILDWRIIAVLCAPLAVLTYQGRGFNTPAAMSQAAPLSKVLASTFFILMIALAAFGFLVRHGMRWWVPVVILQSALLAAAGERTPVIADAVVLIVLLNYVGLRPSPGQVRTVLALTLVVILGITGYRTDSGRTLFHQNSGFITRLQAVGTGLYALTLTPGESATGPGLIAQAATRLDSNAFAGGVLQSMSYGQPRIGVGPVGDSLLLVLPRALWPSKLSHVTELNPAQTEMDDFGLQKINFLPGFFGLYMGFLGIYGVIIFAAISGVFLGFCDRYIFRYFTVTRLVLLAGMMEAILVYQAGLPSMLVAFRPALVVAAAVKMIELCMKFPERHRYKVPRSLLSSRENLAATDKPSDTRTQ